MSDRVATFVILLRAIGPATHKLMRMADWREASDLSGFVEPETLVNTGNMIAGFSGSASAASATMRAVLSGFGLGENVAPIVRRASTLQSLVRTAPLSEAGKARPAQTAVFFIAAAKPDFGWLQDHDGPEIVHVQGNHLMVDFAQDVAQSGKLIRKIDKHCGINTARNWNTTRKLAERCAARTSNVKAKAPS